MNAERIIQAYLDGKQAGMAQTVGKLFLGASPEAEQAGYTEQTERRMFINGFLDVLPERIVTDLNGIITK